MNKAVKIVLKGQVQKRKQDEVALTTVSKLSPERVHEKRRLKAPEMAETSSAQSAKQSSACFEFACKEVQKPQGGKDFFFLNECPKYFFFQLPNLKKDIVRDRSGYCVPGENKKKRLWIIWGSSSYMTYLTPCRNVFKECDKQTIKWAYR